MEWFAAVGVAFLLAFFLCSRRVDAAEEPPAKTFEAHVPLRAVTQGPKAHWFGYYDKHQFDPSDRYLLGMETDFEDRDPGPGETIMLGYIDLEDGDKWTPFAETRAWCWQQGCMLQWLPGSDSEVIYNDRKGDHYISIIQDVFTGAKRELPLPVYTVSTRGQAVAANFARTDETRPGYGYKGVVDPNADQLYPDNDGIYVMDLATGAHRLIITLNAIAKIPHKVEVKGKHWFNHLLWNPDGTRFIFLHRAHPEAEGKGFRTRMFTADPDGGNLHCVCDSGHVSHFIWKNPKQILMWSQDHDGPHYHLYTDQTGTVETIGEEVLTCDGHMTYSPDEEWILTDTYPDRDTRLQALMLYRPADKKLVELGKFYMREVPRGDFRCDLHPRWNRKGDKVCIDSLYLGNQRQLHLLEVGAITGK